MGIPREKLVVVSIMPCLAKKYECDRDEFKVNGVPDVDYSISTRELARLIKRANIGFTLVLDSPFDNPMGESTGSRCHLRYDGWCHGSRPALRL